MTFRNQWLRAADLVQRVQLVVAAVALLALMSVTVADVFMRYVFNKPIRGSYDMVESLLVFFVFHGMSTAFLKRRSIVIDLIDSFAHRYIVTALIRVADVLTIVAIALYSYAMITPAMQAYSYGDLKIDLGLPIYYLWAAALLGMAGAIFCAIGALVSPPAPHRDEPV
jgi:TRAP-type C4-dicarboxylate transport system permease small subunit